MHIILFIRSINVNAILRIFIGSGLPERPHAFIYICACRCARRRVVLDLIRKANVSLMVSGRLKKDLAHFDRRKRET